MPFVKKKLNEFIMNIYESNKHLGKKEFATLMKPYGKDIQSFVFGLRGNIKKYKGRVEHILNPKKLYKFL